MIPTEDGRLIRITSGSLDVNRQLVTVHYTLLPSSRASRS